MTDQAILTKAIEKAIDGGWQFDWVGKKIIRVHGLKGDEFFDVTLPYFIFNHDFAKALWGEEVWGHMYLPHLKKLAWQYHLQMMVIAPDPIKYLAANI